MVVVLLVRIDFEPLRLFASVEATYGSQMLQAGGYLKHPLDPLSLLLSFMLGVTYETPPATLAAIPEMLREMGEAEGVKVARAGFDGFGESSLDFAYILDVPGADWTVAHPLRDRILVAIMNRFAAEGINLAYPTQTSYTAAPDGTPHAALK